jgi:outer membrane receptor protein involved in Fe transport
MANAKFTSRMRKISVGIGANYIGRMKELERTEFVNSDGVNVIRYHAGEELPGYFRFSLNIRLENLELLGVRFDEKFGEKVEERLDDNFDGLYINLRISNVFGNKYFYPTGAVNTWADEGILGRGRQFLFTLGYKF